MRPQEGEMACEKEQDLSQPMRVVESHRERLSLTQIRQDPPDIARRKERRAQGKPEIDGLLAYDTRVRQMREGTERLLEILRRLAISRTCHGLLPRLPAVGEGLL